MKCSYILRLDDACHTMSFSRWRKIEEILDSYQIKPVVAVIPDNLDFSLYYDERNNQFWDLVRGWQSKGWVIAMHGLHHNHHLIKKGEGFVPLYARSEFTSLDLARQKIIIKESWKIFNKNKIRPTVFIAPSHAFDENTLQALYDETDIRIISDGYSFEPYIRDRFVWVPQQLWKFRQMLFGIWTVCLHPSDMSNREIINLEKDLTKYKDKIISINNIDDKKMHRYNIFDILFSKLFLLLFKFKFTISLLRKKNY